MISIFMFSVCIFAMPPLIEGGFAWHTTPPRHVSVHVRLGYTFPEISHPGIYPVSPLTSSYDIYVEEDIDTVPNVNCGTSDGVTLVFRRIDITNRLPPKHVSKVFSRYGKDYDKFTIYNNVNAFMQQICAEMTAEEVYIKNFTDIDDKLKELMVNHHQSEDTGIEIKMVKVYKPDGVGTDILNKFKQRAEHEAKRQALVVENEVQKQKNANELLLRKGEDEVTKQENAARLARELDNKNAELKRQNVDLRIKTEKANNDATISQIDANAKALRVKIEGDARAFVIKQMGDALTPSYVELKKAEASLNNAKMIIDGESIKNGWVNMGPDSSMSKSGINGNAYNTCSTSDCS
jgi:hypothetical protein